MEPILVLTTVGTEEQATGLAEELVERRLSCCVNILPVRRSVYRWKGKVCSDSELLLLIKTAKSEYEAVEAAIREIHEYELPEILSLDVDRGESRFLDWMCDCLDKSAEPDAGRGEG